MKIIFIIYCLFILSFCGKSININMNRFAIFQHRVRNTSMRLIVFNDIYKSMREKILEFISIKEKLIMGNLDPLKSYYYDIAYYYYSLEEEDRGNLELMISLFI